MNTLASLMALLATMSAFRRQGAKSKAELCFIQSTLPASYCKSSTVLPPRTVVFLNIYFQSAISVLASSPTFAALALVHLSISLRSDVCFTRCFSFCSATMSKLANSNVTECSAVTVTSKLFHIVQALVAGFNVLLMYFIWSCVNLHLNELLSIHTVRCANNMDKKEES